MKQLRKECSDVVVYTPESQMRSPAKLCRSMMHDLLDARELAWRLFVRDASARYRQSFLGVLWAFLPPLLSGLVFIILQSRNILNLNASMAPYPLFVLVGTVLWQIFTDSLNAPLEAVQSAKSMLAKLNFPREALILASVYNVLLGLAIKSVVVAAIMIFYKVTLSAGTLLVFPAILMLILLGLTIGLFLTPLGMLYSDVSSSLNVLIQFWFFITPVIYQPPVSFPYSLIMTVNPVSPILVGVRDILLTGTLVNVTPFMTVCAVACLGMFISWVFYRVAMPIIIERISS